MYIVWSRYFNKEQKDLNKHIKGVHSVYLEEVNYR